MALGNLLNACGRPVHLRFATFCCWILALTTWPQPSVAQPAAPQIVMKDYRHLHKPQAVAASARDYATVVEASQRMLAEYPDDAEAIFFLALGQAQLGDVNAAATSIDHARKVGLPAARFLVGPTSWNEAIWNDPKFAGLRDEQRKQLVHGPVLGVATANSVTVWFRTAAARAVAVRARAFTDKAELAAAWQALTDDGSDSIADADDNPRLAIATTRTRAKLDFTGTVKLSNLKPATDYVYDVWVDDQRQSRREQAWTFRTAPLEGEPAQLTFAFGGGAAYTPRFTSMWSTIESFAPDMLLLLGDNIYIDDPQNRDYQRYLYYRRQSEPSYRSLVSRTFTYAIWDDHDFGTNDCWGGPAIDQPAWKRPVWNVFRQNWCNPGYGGGEPQPGCWFEFRYGDVQFLMLDGRYYRDPDPIDAGLASMLGSHQKRWLLETLAKSTAKIKLIASPVPWIGGNPDKWSGFERERAEIFEFLSDHRIEGVVLLSADRHRSDLLVTRRPDDYDLFEFMSSKLTNHHTHREIDERDGALFSYNRKCSFGLVSINTTAQEPRIVFTIIAIDGQPVFRYELTGQQLRTPVRDSVETP